MALLCLCLATLAHAQVANPRVVEFYPSPDHGRLLPGGTAVVSRYQFEVYSAGASAPFHTIDLAKPPPQGDGKIRFDFSTTIAAWPLPGGAYEARVAAVGPNGTGRSTASNLFTVTPAVTDRKGDGDGDGMDDAWETRFEVSDPRADADGDGVLNLDEYRGGTDPRIPNQQILAEGSTEIFAQRIALANPNTAPATVRVAYLRPAPAAPVERQYSVPAQQRLTIDTNAIPELVGKPFSAVVTNVAGGAVAERTMFWGAGYKAGHTGKGAPRARTAWFLAEGDAGFFDTFILLANNNDVPITVSATFMLEARGGQTVDPVQRTYTVAARSRYNIATFTDGALAGRAFSTRLTSSLPFNVERAMYFAGANGTWKGGHVSGAVAEAAPTWFLAEGSTGANFQTYVLLANPNPWPVRTTVTYLRQGAAPVVEDRPEFTMDLPGNSRRTILVNAHPLMRNVSFSTRVEASSDIVVERAMYWPLNYNTWTEAHASAGVVETGTRWLLAEGQQGGPLGFESYVLVANPAPAGGPTATVTVRLLRQGKAPLERALTVEAGRRSTLSSAAFVADGLASGEQFGIEVVSTNGVPVVAERAMYWNGGGIPWGGGSNETAVKIR